MASTRKGAFPRDVSKLASPENGPKHGKVLIGSKDVKGRGYLRALSQNEVIRFTKKGKMLPGRKLTLRRLGLSKKSRKGLVFEVSVELTTKKGKRKKVHRSSLFIVHPGKKWKETRSNMPRAILASLNQAVQRSGFEVQGSRVVVKERGKLVGLPQADFDDVRVRVVLTRRKTKARVNL